MKKILFLAVVLILACAMLISCADNKSTGNEGTENEGIENGDKENGGDENEGEEKEEEKLDAAEIMDNVMLKMNSYDSYEANLSAEGTILIGSETSIDVTAEGKIIEIGMLEGEYYYYEITKMQMFYDDYIDSMTNLEAYNDGDYFLMRADGDKSNRICSSMTSLEAKEYVKAREEESDLILNGEKIEYKQDSDGRGVLIISELSGETLDKLDEELGFSYLPIEFSLKDVKTTIYIDAELNIQRIDIEYLFEESEELEMTMTFCIELSSLGSAQKDTTRLDKLKYTPVSDIRALDKIEDMYSARKDAENGSLSFEMRQTATVAERIQTTLEKDKVSYGVSDGNYKYSVSCTNSAIKSEINSSYENGIITMVFEGKSYTEASTDAMAKAYISESFIDVADFSRKNVKAMSKKEYYGETVYTIDYIIGDESKYESIYEQAGAVYKNASLELKVYESEDEITRSEAVIILKGYVYGSNNYRYDLLMTISVITDFE